MTPEQVATAFRAACADELEAAKPGNVHVHAAGHGMTIADFRRSAEAAAGPLCQPAASLGTRVLGAVAATRAAVGQNTNLGIVLLCAPLAMAAETAAGDLRERLAGVLDAAGADDTDAVFRAIVLASPGGLGAAARHDVHGPASVALREAMAEAAPRDRIARQYATNFSDVFGPLSDAYEAALGRHGSRVAAALATYLHCLSAWPDSHVARKHGTATAEAVRAAAAARVEQSPEAMLADLLLWDGELKRRHINPGTSADLTVATCFLHHLRNTLPLPADNG